MVLGGGGGETRHRQIVITGGKNASVFRYIICSLNVIKHNTNYKNNAHPCALERIWQTPHS